MSLKGISQRSFLTAPLALSAGNATCLGSAHMFANPHLCLCPDTGVRSVSLFQSVLCFPPSTSPRSEKSMGPLKLCSFAQMCSLQLSTQNRVEMKENERYHLQIARKHSQTLIF